MPPDNLTVKTARDADRDEISTAYAKAFGFDPRRSADYIDQVGVDNFRMAVWEGRMVGVMAVIETAHWLGARPVKAVNIAHVAIDPVYRGAGFAGAFLETICRNARQDGFALATLFASTRPVYRRAGFALAGSEIVYEADTKALPRSRSTAFRRVERQVAVETIAPIYERHCRQGSGLLRRAEAHWAHILAGDPAIYLSTAENAEGYLILDTTDTACLEIRDWAALGPEAATHLLTLAGTFSSVYPKLRWHGAPHDPLIYALPDKGWRLAHQEEWLARVLDPVAALEQRGYSSDAALGIDLVSPAGVLELMLTVTQGRGTCSPRSQPCPTVSLALLDFGTLLTGHRSAGFLAQAGVLSGEMAAISACNALFSGPLPWVGEHF